MLTPKLLSSLDKLRALPDKLGLRPYSLSVFVTSTTAALTYPGNIDDGYTSVTEIPILVDGKNPQIKNTSSRSAMASSEAGEKFWYVTLTPSYTSGGFNFINIPKGSTIDYVIKGVGLPASGVSCELTSVTQTSTKVTVTLRSKGGMAP